MRSAPQMLWKRGTLTRCLEFIGDGQRTQADCARHLPEVAYATVASELSRARAWGWLETVGEAGGSAQGSTLLYQRTSTPLPPIWGGGVPRKRRKK